MLSLTVALRKLIKDKYQAGVTRRRREIAKEPCNTTVRIIGMWFSLVMEGLRQPVFSLLHSCILHEKHYCCGCGEELQPGGSCCSSPIFCNTGLPHKPVQHGMLVIRDPLLD